MKTKQLVVAGLLALSVQFSNAQATTASATNTVTSTAYLGSGSTSNFDVLFKRNNVPAGQIATTFTNFGVNSFATTNSVSFGVNAGQYSSGTGSNTYIGENAGKGISAMSPNNGSRNTFIGYGAGFKNSGGQNIHIGYYSGNLNEGHQNIFIGNYSGADDGTSGDGNIFIGHNAGYYEYSGHKLFIENSDSDNPLIWGDFAEDQLKFNAKVGIGYDFGSYPTDAGGVDVSGYNLFVTGGILTEEVRVNLHSGWADYVFQKGYDLKPLSEVEQFITDNGHLPNVPCAEQVKEQGIELGEMAKIQQEKIEELTLYVIEQHKINQSQSKEIEELKAQMKLLLERK